MIRLLIARTALQMIDRMLGKGPSKSALPEPSFAEMLPALVVGKAFPRSDGSWIYLVKSGDVKVYGTAPAQFAAMFTLNSLIAEQTRTIQQ